MGETSNKNKNKIQELSNKLTSAGEFMTNNFTSPLKEATTSYGEFEEKMTKVSSIADISMNSIKNLSDGVLEISNNTGESSVALGEALYKTISATKDTGNALEYLNIASKSAKGGFTDTETAITGITSVMNEYGINGKDNMQKVADLMIKTQNLGKISFGELAQSLQGVVPTAASLNIGFDQVSAAMATIASKGVPTNTAVSQLQKLLQELSKDGGKTSEIFKTLSGKSFSDFIKSGGTVQGALNIMDTAARKNGKSIKGLFDSIDAGNAAMQLTGNNSKKFSDNLKSMENATGSVDNAYKKMKQGFKSSINELSNSMKNIIITIGQYMVPTINKVIKSVQNIVNYFNKLSPFTKGIIAKILLFTMAIGPVLSVIGKIGKAIVAVVDGFNLLKTGIRIFSNLPMLLSPPILIAVAIIGSLGFIIYQVIKHWDLLKQVAKNFVRDICAVFSKMGNFFAEKIDNCKQTWHDFCGFMGKVGDWICDGLLGGLKRGFNNVIDFIHDMGSGIKNTFKKVLGINSPSRVFKAYGGFIDEGLIEGIEGQENVINSKFNGLANKIKNLGKVKPSFENFGFKDIALYEGYGNNQELDNLGLSRNMGITQNIKMYITIPNADIQGANQLANEFKTVTQSSIKNSMVDLFMKDALRN